MPIALAAGEDWSGMIQGERPGSYLKLYQPDGVTEITSVDGIFTDLPQDAKLKLRYVFFMPSHLPQAK